jgi:transcriptional repressor NrdR
MRCPYCSDRNSKVTDSRVNDVGIRRRRECLNCQRRFTTHERVQTVPLMVSKRDGRREEFSRDKMISGLRKACAKRPVTASEIDLLVDEVEAEFQQNGSGEVSSDLLGTAIMDRLRDLDTVAYIRFASVHRNFQEMESFERAVRDLRDDNSQLPLLDMPPPSRRTAKGRRRGGAAAANRNGRPQGQSEYEGVQVEEYPDENLSEAVGTLGGEKE